MHSVLRQLIFALLKLIPGLLVTGLFLRWARQFALNKFDLEIPDVLFVPAVLGAMLVVANWATRIFFQSANEISQKELSLSKKAHQKEIAPLTNTFCKITVTRTNCRTD
jgi:hypothetical protein